MIRYSSSLGELHIELGRLRPNRLLVAIAYAFVFSRYDAPARADGEPSKDAQAAVADSTGEDWPRWRGPLVDGVSPEENWTHDWPAEGPVVLWRKNIGIGFSGVSICNGRLYTMGRAPTADQRADLADAGKAPPTIEVERDAASAAPEKKAPANAANDGELDHAGAGDDYVWCLDPVSGQTLWRYAYPCPLYDILHEGGPAATPTVAEDKVYTVSKAGDLYCFDAHAGKPLWFKNAAQELGVQPPAWGFSGSPLIYQDLVILDFGKTAAFDKNTGELRWQTASYRAGYSSPIRFTCPANGQDRVAVLNNDYLLILDPNDGREIAKVKWETAHPTNAATPIISENKIFISSGYGRGCALFEFDGHELSRLYEHKKMRNHMNSCVLWNGLLYGFDGNTHSRRAASLICMDFLSGDVKWRERKLGVGSVLCAGGRLIVLSDEGELLVVAANPKQFEALARFSVVEGKCWTPPTLSHGLVYVRDAAGDLACLDLHLRLTRDSARSLSNR